MTEFNAKNYCEERLKKNRGLHGVGYMGYGKYFNTWMYRIRKNIFFTQIKSLNLNLAQARVLDIGSGTGFYLALWESLGAQLITGSDISEFAVSQLQNTYSELSILQLDIGSSLDEQKIEIGSFNIITAFDVLFHIVDDDKFHKAIFNISRLLIPGGYFVFSDNFLHNKTIRTTHQVSRSIKEITGILEKAGFQIIKRVPMFALMNYPVDTAAPWPARMWLAFMRPVGAFKLLGFLYGAILFPFEIILTRLLKEDPTTELMVCRKLP